MDPALTAANRRLRNNLELRVYAPGTPNAELSNLNSTFATKPWVLNPDLTTKSATTRALPATRGIDTANNLEQVEITTPVANGVYTIVIKAPASLSGSLPQWVSAGISGRTLPTPPPGSTIFSTSFVNGLYSLNLHTYPGGMYKVQGTANLFSGPWVDLSSYQCARGDTMQFVVAPHILPLPTSYFLRVARIY